MFECDPFHKTISLLEKLVSLLQEKPNPPTQSSYDQKQTIESLVNILGWAIDSNRRIELTLYGKILQINIK